MAMALTAPVAVGLRSSPSQADRAAAIPVPSTRARVSAEGSPQGVVYTFGVVDSFGALMTLVHSTPTAVAGIHGTVIQIAASNSNGYALTSDGRVWAWGAGGQGELGNGTTPRLTAKAVAVQFPPGVKIASLANPMPFDTGIAIDTQGDAWGWGANTEHALCLRGTGPILFPEKLPLNDVRLASGARSHSLFLAHGRVVACGDNAAGDLGNGTLTPRAAPTAVVGLPRGQVVALVSSWQGSGALFADGRYFDWGFNLEGQLGDGTTRHSSIPVQVRLPAPVERVFQGGSQPSNGQTLALLADGSLWAWGDGKWGQLGDGRYVSSSRPVKVLVPRGVRFTDVATGGYASYAISSAGVLWSWGSNRLGQLGDGQAELLTARPRSTGLMASQVVSTDVNVVAYGISGTA
jgi:alpha-tubulin suppressor-like RCC1 family protein